MMTVVTLDFVLRKKFSSRPKTEFSRKPVNLKLLEVDFEHTIE